ncbi:MAG: BON domain-containing protein [Myxococcaceae bacterium]
MDAEHPMVRSIHAALERDPRVDLHHHPVRLTVEDSLVVLEGEAASVAAKKRCLEHAAAQPGVSGIIDRLHVEPSQRMSDGEVRDRVRDALLGEPALQPFALRVRHGRELQSWREPAEPRGAIEVRVADGVVTLDGEVSSLAAKRLAGVLAWWVPGTRDVVNGLGVDPAELDGDEEITDATAIVLDKDPLLNAGEIAVHTRGAVVTLTGVVHSDEQKAMAEEDAWCVFGVDGVENRLRVVR